ncbi:hypothetical protein [Crocosphaera sp.]|uniref:hypothetical protein n=1 Tax=Crocosphaera sp. TaxID=2729996 RepID=UPI002620304F|nr:hypothetical protein [Crocosphaera sp.]MDJ0578503.1 hypothetical protein [Crocosphaera sp.]
MVYQWTQSEKERIVEKFLEIAAKTHETPNPKGRNVNFSVTYKNQGKITHKIEFNLSNHYLGFAEKVTPKFILHYS